MDAEVRFKIISAFGAHLEAMKSVLGCESKLPYPKELIRQALAEELASPTMPKLVDAMESSFLSLEDFVSDQEYAVVQRHERLLAQRGQLQNADGAVVKNYAKEAADALGAMLPIVDRCTSQKAARIQQLAQIRALRRG